MTSEQRKSIREILEEALKEIRREHGVSVHAVRVEWLGTMEEPEIDEVLVEPRVLKYGVAWNNGETRN